MKTLKNYLLECDNPTDPKCKEKNKKKCLKKIKSHSNEDEGDLQNKEEE